MKRSWLSLLLLFLGAFLLTVGAVSRFWAADAAERTPLDSYNRTYLTGEADKLDPATGEVPHFPVKITNITQVDADRSTDDVVVFVTSTCVNQDVDDPPDCLTDEDPRMISVSQSNFATDRHTAEAVNDPKYVENDPPISGLVNKWPFNTEKKDYRDWDDLTAPRPRQVRRHERDPGPRALPVRRHDHRRTDRPRQQHRRHLQPERELVGRPAHREDRRPAAARRADLADGGTPRWTSRRATPPTRSRRTSTTRKAPTSCST